MDDKNDQRIWKPKPKSHEPILTIGMPNYKDRAGASFTIANILQTHSECLKDIEILVLDNCPGTDHSEDITSMLKGIPNAHYVAYTPYAGSFAKNAVFMASQTEYVLCCDSHITFLPGALKKLINFLRASHPTNDLFQGPIATIDGKTHATHMNPALRRHNFGIWGTYKDPKIDEEIYEVPMTGCGVLCCRRDNWPMFHPALFQFGSEEGYIHEKFRLRGDKCYSLPFLKWWHLFRNKSVKSEYPARLAHKYRNFLISWREVGLPLEIVEQEYEGLLARDVRKYVQENVDSLNVQPLPRPIDYEPMLGYPIRRIVTGDSEGERYAEFEKPKYVSR